MKDFEIKLLSIYRALAQTMQWHYPLNGLECEYFAETFFSKQALKSILYMYLTYCQFVKISLTTSLSSYVIQSLLQNAMGCILKFIFLITL